MKHTPSKPKWIDHLLVCFFMICCLFFFTTSPHLLQDFLLSTVESTRPYASYSFPSPCLKLMCGTEASCSTPYGVLAGNTIVKCPPQKNFLQKFPPSPNGHCLKENPPFPKWIPHKIPRKSSGAVKPAPQVSARRRCLVFAPEEKTSHFFV